MKKSPIVLRAGSFPYITQWQERVLASFDGMDTPKGGDIKKPLATQQPIKGTP